MSNDLDLDQDQHSLGPDLDPNCLQRLSADDKILARKDLLTYIGIASFLWDKSQQCGPRSDAAEHGA